MKTVSRETKLQTQIIRKANEMETNADCLNKKDIRQRLPHTWTSVMVCTNRIYQPNIQSAFEPTPYSQVIHPVP